MASDKQEKIRSRAYQIWEREGRPEGREQQHWAQAAHEIENEERAGDDVSRGVTPTVADDPTRRASSPGDAAAGQAGAPPRSGPGAPTGSSGIASGLQPGGARPGGGPAATQGGIGTGGGSTAGRATGSEPGRKE